MQQSLDVGDTLVTGLQKRVDINRRAVRIGSVEFPAGVFGGVFEDDSGTRVPSAQVRQPGRVVLIEEVFDGVLLATAGALAVSGGQRVGAVRVSLRNGRPLGPREHGGAGVDHPPIVSAPGLRPRACAAVPADRRLPTPLPSGAYDAQGGSEQDVTRRAAWLSLIHISEP